MKNKLRVLQLIDSLRIGGAERMSVNLANVLASEKGIKSFLCATREGGSLESFIDESVPFFILEKKSTLDMRALFRLVGYVKRNHIDMIHAHSSSFFIATLCKLFTGVKVVWHDHYGMAEELERRKGLILRICSLWFDGVISVNEKLRDWAKERLFVSHDRIDYLPNFALLAPLRKEPQLPGTVQTRIVSLANLREQKDHMNLLKAFSKLVVQYPQWHLLLVGNDLDDDYSRSLKAYTKRHGLDNCVHFLGTRTDTADILHHSSIGVLSSVSEGLPVALLEYGLSALAVVCTDVGQCSDVLQRGKYGKLVPPKNTDALASALESLIVMSPQDRKETGDKLKEFVAYRYGWRKVRQPLLETYRKVIG